MIRIINVFFIIAAAYILFLSVQLFYNRRPPIESKSVDYLPKEVEESHVHAKPEKSKRARSRTLKPKRPPSSPRYVAVNEYRPEEPPAWFRLILDEPNAVYIATYERSVWLYNSWPATIPNCTVRCYINCKGVTKADPYTQKVDAIFYHTQQHIAEYYDKRQLGIFFATEPDDLFPFQRESQNSMLGTSMRASATYHSHSDPHLEELRQEGRIFEHFQLTYVYFHAYNSMFEPPLSFGEKKSDAIAVVFTSNCVHTTSDRIRWIKGLMDVIGVHSYGTCEKNRREVDEPDCKSHHHQFARKQCIIRKYKFYLAFENSIDDSYVSEKYFQGLASGAVPVYLGAPNIRAYDPLYDNETSQTALIRVSDFETPQQLGQFLKDLAGDETRYNQYLRWKLEPPRPHFKDIMDSSFDFPQVACKICKWVHKNRTPGMRA